TSNLYAETMFGNQFIYSFEPEANLDKGMVLHQGYLLGGSYHRNDSIFLLNYYGVRWQVERAGTCSMSQRTTNKDLRCFVTDKKVLCFGGAYSMLQTDPVAQTLPLVFVPKVYSTSQSDTVDLFIKDRECEVFIGKIPSMNRPKTFKLAFYGPDWWSMMDELAIRPGQYFALTLVRGGKFSLTVFNTKGEALTACENYVSYMLQNSNCHIEQEPEWAGIAIGGGTLITRISKGFIDRHKLRGYASTVVSHRDKKFEFKLCKKSKSVEMFSTTTLRDMVRSDFWCGEWVRFYLSKDTSLVDRVIRFEVC
ncbi:hypothetical protein Tco_1325448, partial [Tanacetum coccineum]